MRAESAIKMGRIKLRRERDMGPRLWAASPVVAQGAGDDSGKKLLRAARPGWKRAQKRFQAAMGGARWDTMWSVLGEITAALKEE